MNWDSLGIFAEIVSALAVLITLIYLASQIRQAKAATLGQLVQDRTSEFNVLCNTVIGSGDIAAILAELSSNTTLTPAEIIKLRTFIMMLWNQVYAAYVQRKRGLITDEEFALTEGTVGFIITVIPGYGDSSFGDPTYGPLLFGTEFSRWASEIRRKLETQDSSIAAG